MTFADIYAHCTHKNDSPHLRDSVGRIGQAFQTLSRHTYCHQITHVCRIDLLPPSKQVVSISPHPQNPHRKKQFQTDTSSKAIRYSVSVALASGLSHVALASGLSHQTRHGDEQQFYPLLRTFCVGFLGSGIRPLLEATPLKHATYTKRRPK